MEFFVKVMFSLYLLRLLITFKYLMKNSYPRTFTYSKDIDVGVVLVTAIFLVWMSRLIWI